MLLLAVVVGVLVGAAPAGAVIVRNANGQKISIAPAQNAAHRFSCTTSCSALTYHNGPVQHGTETDYLIFWVPSGRYVPPAYKSGLNQYLNDAVLGDFTAGNHFSLDQELYDLSGPSGAKRFVPYGLLNGGTLTDTHAYPASGCSDTDGNGTPMSACLTEAQIQTELKSFVSSKGLPQDMKHEYFVFTPVGVGSCFDSTSTSCSYTGYCAWHSSMTGTTAGSTILFADMPWQHGVPGCDTNTAFGTGSANDDGLDPVVSTFTHEASETMTDPLLNAWFDASGNENADKCAFTYGSGGFGSTAGLANNGLGYWNQLMAGNEYLVQQEFSNRLLDCKTTDTDTQPTFSAVTVSPATPVNGSSATFTATASAPSGIAYVTWNFGDGTSTITSTLSTTHTYATAGTKKASFIVTDNHGNEKRLNKTITVS